VIEAAWAEADERTEAEAKRAQVSRANESKRFRVAEMGLPAVVAMIGFLFLVTPASDLARKTLSFQSCSELKCGEVQAAASSCVREEDPAEAGL